MRFTESHEWAAMKGEIARVGITPFAQGEWGEIVYVELPKVGSSLEKGQEAVVIESTKAAADIYSPLTGEVVAVNEELISHPENVNRSPQGAGWLFEIKISDPSEYHSLMDENAYGRFIKE